MSFLPKPKAEADNTQNPNLVIFFIIHYLNNLHKEILPSELPKLETLLGRRKSQASPHDPVHKFGLNQLRW